MLALGEEDLRLIGVLQAAPRMSWTDVARVLGVHATSVAARWERLRTAGAAWVTALPNGDPRQMCLAVMNVDYELSHRIEVILALTVIPEVMTVEEVASDRHLILFVLAPSISALATDITPRLTNISGIKYYTTLLCTRIHFDSRAWRLDVLAPSEKAVIKSTLEQESRTPNLATTLPRRHRDLFSFLARDGRIKAAEIARALDRHPVTVQRQLNRIIADQCLSFRCEIAQRYSGYPITCVWFANIPPKEHAAAAYILRRSPNVRFSASTAGSTNFLIVMWLRDLSDVLSVEIALSERIPGIHLVNSAVAIGSSKRAGWVLRPDTTTTGYVAIP